MNITMKTVEHLKVLNDLSVSLCNRLYHLRSELIARNKRYSCLYDSDISKIRSRLEKKFPSLPHDPKKYSDWDTFFNHSSNVASSLAGAYDLFLDVIDFSDCIKEAWKGITLSIIDFKLSRNRNIMVVFLDALVGYMRVLKLFDGIEEKLTIIALHTAAYTLLNEYSVRPGSGHEITATGSLADSSLKGRTDRLQLLVAECVDLNRHFIDFFASSMSCVRPIVFLLRDSVGLMNQYETLRKDGVLSPINEGDSMGLPAIKPLNSSCKVSTYTELMCLEQYYEYVVFIFIAFPSFLFQEPLTEVLRAVLSSRFVICLWRDVSINVHEELERISMMYPSSLDNLSSFPKGIKLKSVLKSISRASLATAGCSQQGRRSFLEAELSTLNNLIRAVPGLIAPKLPMLLACAGLARSELVAYFRHAEAISSPGGDHSGGVYIRKDSKLHFNAQQYTTEDAVASLWHELSVAIGLIRKHHHIITAYYVEYLSVADVSSLDGLVPEVDHKFDSIQPYLDSIRRELVAVGKEGVAVASLEALRLNWDRVVSVVCSQLMLTALRGCAVSFDALAQRMLSVCDRTWFAHENSLLSLIDVYLDPYPMGWFRSSLLNSYALAMKDPHGLARHCFVYFEPFQSIAKNLHEEFPEERSQLYTRAVHLSNLMLVNLSDFVITLVNLLWENLSVLESQYQPLEAANRIERAMNLKTKAPSAEALPGCESEVWAKQKIAKFVLIQQHLAGLTTAARSKGLFTIATREYIPDLFLREQLVGYFQSRFHGLFMSTSTSNDTPVASTVQRFSSALHKLTCGCRALQYTLRFMNTSIDSIMVDLWFRETQDANAVAIPGLPMTLNVQLTKDKLICKLSRWFVELALEVSRPGSGLVWAPSQQCFLNIAHKRHVASELGGGDTGHGKGAVAFPAELYLNKEELTSLALVVGVQGVRTIESQLLSVLAEQVLIALKFIGDNKLFLTQFERDYCLNVTAASGILKQDVLFDALRLIGIIVVMRDMLDAALGACYSQRFPDIHSTLRSAVQSLHLDGGGLSTELCAPLMSLANSMGICSSGSSILSNWSSTGAGRSVTDRDLDLCWSLARLDLAADHQEELRLLPAAASALYLCDKWEKAIYLPQLEAFQLNEHCIQVALSKLFSTAVVLSTSHLGQLNIDGHGHHTSSSSYDEHKSDYHHGSSQQLTRDHYRNYVERYLSLASQALLTQREAEASVASHFPYRSMSVLLEYFVSLCPGEAIDRGVLERHFPNYLVHCDLVDVSLGRHKHNHALHPFVHRSAQDDSLGLY